MSAAIILESGADGFAENKDAAKSVRVSRVLPAIESSERVVLDFRNIKYATQSYIHALIGEALQRYGEAALGFIEFKNCAPAVRGVVELVVDYSLGGFAGSSDKMTPRGA